MNDYARMTDYPSTSRHGATIVVCCYSSIHVRQVATSHVQTLFSTVDGTTRHESCPKNVQDYGIYVDVYIL